tara:strand:- start:1208 stop:3727 length:2520 start_codon:yes stop_codon:yes gene_type:complete
MAENTINAGQFPTENFLLSDFIVKTLADGTLQKDTVQNLANILETIGEVGFKGKLLIADIPTIDGWWFAGETGTYINSGGLIVDLNNNLSIIVRQTTFSKIDIPLNITTDPIISGNTGLAISGDVADAIKVVDDERIFDDVVLKENIDNKADVIKVIGKNLFNLNTVIPLKYVRYNDGELADNTSKNASEFVKVDSSTEYTRSYEHDMAFYDIDKIYISGISAASNINTFTTPSNCIYLRLSVDNTVMSTMQLELGGVSTTYESYTDIIYLNNTIVKVEDVDGIVDIPVDFIYTIGKNKFNINANDTVLGRFINGVNSTSANASYNITGYIPVDEGITYVSSYEHNKEFYDADKNSVLYEANGGTGVVTAPVGAVYFRASVQISFWDLFQFEIGTVPTSWKAYESYYIVPSLKISEDDIISSSEKLVNISTPKKQYLLGGYENSFYFNGLVDKFKTDNYIRFGVPFFNYQKLSRLTNPTTENTGVTIEVLDDNFDTIDSTTFDVLIGEQATDNGLVNGVGIGDSFTHSGKYLKKVYDVCPNINFDGLRSTDDIAPYPFKYEGRGGWTLQKYFNPFNAVESHSPFMHHATYNYYGQTAFWWNVLTNNPTGYQYDMFQIKAAEIGFNSLTGIKTTPVLNDLMYFDKDGSNVYKYFNGSVWVDAVLTSDDFTFNFAKYRSIWSIIQPDIVTVYLGLNDFRGASNVVAVQSAFTEWKTQMDALIASVLVDNASAKIAICLPASYCGKDDNLEGVLNAKLNRNMWEARKLIIAEYDEREGDSIYVVDMGIVTDPKYAYKEADEVPFSDYDGSEVRTIDSNTPHVLTSGYNQIGVKLAAFIQKIR